MMGRIQGLRAHQPVSFDKEIDASSPLLYKALTCGENLERAIFRFYSIDDAGRESNYFSVTLEGIKVESCTSIMYDIKSEYGEKRNHLECVDLGYEKITWHYIDGNIIHSDSWNDRA